MEARGGASQGAADELMAYSSRYIGEIKRRSHRYGGVDFPRLGVIVQHRPDKRHRGIGWAWSAWRDGKCVAEASDFNTLIANVKAGTTSNPLACSQRRRRRNGLCPTSHYTSDPQDRSLTRPQSGTTNGVTLTGCLDRALSERPNRRHSDRRAHEEPTYERRSLCGRAETPFRSA